MGGDSTPEVPQDEAPQGPVLGVQKSCADCSHLRLRCVRDTAGGSCYRCIRYNRPCRARERKTRPGPKPKPPPAHIAELEAKVANLANILATQRRAMPQLGSLESEELKQGSQSPIQSSASSITERSAEPRGPATLKFPPPPPIVSYQTYVLRNQERLSQLGQPPPPDLKVNYDAADLLLGKFQTVMTGYFPFVVIPAGINAMWLQQAKPFLFMCVIGLSSQQSVLQQESMTLAIMKYLSHHMFFAGVKSLDLLQGLLVYISWYHIHQQSQNNNQITNLLQMAISLLIDLGLNKAPRQTNMQTAVDNSIRSAPDIPRIRTKDERRALLGCFYLTSVISSSFKKMEAIRYNSHVEESYRVIAASPEYRSDLYLVHLVRLQHFAENVTQSLPYDLPERSWEMKPPIGMFVQSYQAELKMFTDFVPAELRTSSSLQIHIQSNEIHLYEIALCKGAGHATYGSFALGRTDILHSCMLSAKQLITTFLELPIVEYRNFPFVMWVQMMHAILVLSKLSTLKDPGWDLVYVQSVVHFPEILDQFLVKFQLAKDAEDPYHQPMCRWNAYAQRVQRLKMWYESKLVTQAAQSGTAASPIAVLDDHPFNRTGPENPVPAIQYNFGELDDDTFWRDVMGGWGSV